MKRYTIFVGNFHASKLKNIIKSKNYNWLDNGKKSKFTFRVFITDDQSYGFSFSSEKGYSTLYVLSAWNTGLSGTICARWEEITGKAELKQIGLFKDELTARIVNTKLPRVLAEIIASFLV